ncbi:MAG: hypothetical protein DWQ07_25860 [Chloroflexi bacterium]|nr:MAG: hypothetical protein DWQ07_25860 [Chloroflexota bacterium]
MPIMTLTASVGRGGVNESADVIALKKRLFELGYDWLIVDDTVTNELEDVINLIQSIRKGRDIRTGDGRVDVPGETYDWIRAHNAPGWQEMPQGFVGDGFENIELLDLSDKHDFGTSWMAQTIIDAGRFYNDRWLSNNPNAALLTINDVSLPRGGSTPDHSGHQSGIACDIRLPRTDNTAPAGTSFIHAAYDQETMRAMLQAIRHQPFVEHILFNDPVLESEGLCKRDKPGITMHDNHAHFELLPFLPVTIYDRPVQELFEQAIIFFGGNSIIDPAMFPMTMEGFQEYLEFHGIMNFSAREFLEPHHKNVATNLGYSIFLPPHHMWSRGAALGMLAQQIRNMLDNPVIMRNWWRPKAYNDSNKVGGKPESEHIRAYAMDLDFGTSDDRRNAEAILKQLVADESWLQISLGLGDKTIHVGLLSPKGHRIWHYNDYVP